MLNFIPVRWYNVNTRLGKLYLKAKNVEKLDVLLSQLLSPFSASNSITANKSSDSYANGIQNLTGCLTGVLSGITVGEENYALEVFNLEMNLHLLKGNKVGLIH